MPFRHLAALMLALAALVAPPARAEALLLPTLTVIPNTFLALRCDGLSVMDVATSQVQRHYPDFGCVDAVAGAGATRAVAILRVDSDALTPDRLDYLDLVRGRIIDELVLAPTLVSGQRFLRMLDDSRALLQVAPRLETDTQSRLVRANLVDGHWQAVADVTVDGRISTVGSGDTLAVWRVQAGGLHVDLRRADDLSTIRSLDLQDASTDFVWLVFVARGRVHVLRGPSTSALTVRSYDTTSGLLQRTIPWSHGPGPFVDVDADGRVRLRRTVSTQPPSINFRTQLVSVDLDTDAVSILAEGVDGLYPVGIAHLGEQSVLFQGTDYICFNVCIPTPDSPYSFTAGATLQLRRPAIYTSPPNSMQFLVPSFIAGGTAAEVPALDPTGALFLTGALLLAALAQLAKHRHSPASRS